MLLGFVKGSVVSTKTSDRLNGAVYLLVEEWSADNNPSGKFYIALDPLGTGEGEMVLVSQGSSARQTAFTKDTAVDAVVIGIVDRVDSIKGILYKK